MDKGTVFEQNDRAQLIASVEHIFKASAPPQKRGVDQPPGPLTDVSDTLKDEAKFRFVEALHRSIPNKISMTQSALFTDDEIRVMEETGGKPYVYEKKRPLKIPLIPSSDDELGKLVALQPISQVREAFADMMQYLQTPALGDEFSDHELRRKVREDLELLKKQTGNTDVDTYNRIDNANQLGGNFIYGKAVGGIIHLGSLARIAKNLPLQQILADKAKQMIYLIQGDDGVAYLERMGNKEKVAVIRVIEGFIAETMQELLIPKGQDVPSDTILVT